MNSTHSALAQSIAMVNGLTVGMSPAMAMGSQYQNIAYSLGLASLNQVFAQQQSNIIQQSASVVNVIRTIR